MKFQTTSITTWSFVHLILPWIRLQTSTIQCRIFRKIETKRRCCADYIGSDSYVATQVRATVFIPWLLLNRSFDISICVFTLNHNSMHLWRLKTVKHTQVLANHSSGRLLSSLQSITPKQSILMGGENIYLLLLNIYFLCKNLDNIIRGPQRTVQKNK